MVSVVMPVYNAEKYLREAIQSILTQNYPNLEMIVVNDGSTDSSKNIILSFEDPRLRYFENPENWGIVRTRNRALAEATGEYVAVLDSDDVALPNKIRSQVEFMEKNPEFELCGSYFKTIDGSGQILKNVKFPSNDGDARSMLLVHNCFCHSTIVMRSRLAKEFKYKSGFDLVEDYELWYRISQVGKIINLPVHTTYYRVHGNNISTNKNRQMFNKADRINGEILRDLEISYTPEEFEIHSKFQHYQFSYFADPQKIDRLEQWMIRLMDEIKKKNLYNEIVIYRVLAKKWIVICKKTGHYRRIFFNRIFTRHPMEYIATFYKKIKKSI